MLWKIKMVNLYKDLNEVYGTGSCSGWVSEWVVSEFEG